MQRYFGLEDLATIGVADKACTKDTCAINSVDELRTYAKYCTFVPDACSMQEFTFAKTGEWPIAEMNILVQQGIFTTSDLQNLNIEDYAQ